MPPVDPVHVRAYAEQAEAVAVWLATADPARPTLLPGWKTAHLAVHVAASGDAFTAALDRPRPPRGTVPLSVGAALAGYADAAAEIDAREQAAVAAGFSRDETVDRLRTSAARVVAAADDLEGDPVVQGPRGPVRAGDLFRTRVVELVVHALDVEDGWPQERQAVRLTTRLFAEVLAERHPGRSVEVRVPPYAAVQLGDGPVHTRGTPPNVVECDPAAFVAVASGRRAWADAVAHAEVRASGQRADLSAYLPLL